MNTCENLQSIACESDSIITNSTSTDISIVVTEQVRENLESPIILEQNVAEIIEDSVSHEEPEIKNVYSLVRLCTILTYFLNLSLK